MLDDKKGHRGAIILFDFVPWCLVVLNQSLYPWLLHTNGSLSRWPGSLWGCSFNRNFTSTYPTKGKGACNLADWRWTKSVWFSPRWITNMILSYSHFLTGKGSKWNWLGRGKLRSEKQEFSCSSYSLIWIKRKWVCRSSIYPI